MFDLAGKLDLVATSSDASVLAALGHARAHHAARRDHIPLPPPADGEDDASGIAFASGNWRRAVTDRRRPGMAVRRHFEAMVFTYLAEELRTGDIAVASAGEYADWRQSAALGRMRAAAGGILRRGRAARDGGRVHRAAPARPPGRHRGAGRRVRGQRRPGDRRGRRPGPQAAPQRGHPGGGRAAGGGGRAADAGAVAAVDRGPHRVLAGLAPPLRPGVGVGPEDRRPAGPVLHGGVHRRGQHRPVRGGPAHRRGVGPRAVDGPQPAHRPEEAQLRHRDRGQRVRRARRGKGVGRRHRGGRRRHPSGNLHRQPAGRDLDQVRNWSTHGS